MLAFAMGRHHRTLPERAAGRWGARSAAALLLVAGLALLLTPVPALSAAGWQADCKQARQALKAGDADRAADLTARAAQKAIKELEPSDRQLLEVLALAGQAHAAAGRAAAAGRYYRYALTLARNHHQADHQRIVFLKNQLARLKKGKPARPLAQAQPVAKPPPTTVPRPKKPVAPRRPLAEAPEKPDLGLRVEIVHRGLFTHKGQEPESQRKSRVTYDDADVGGAGNVSRVKEVKLLKSTERVPNAPGTVFGFSFMLYGKPGHGKAVRLTLRVLSPRRRMSGTRHWTVSEEVDFPLSIGEGSRWLYAFGGTPDTRPPGKWTFQILHDGRKLGEQSFTVYAAKADRPDGPGAKGLGQKGQGQ